MSFVWLFFAGLVYIVAVIKLTIDYKVEYQKLLSKKYSSELDFSWHKTNYYFNLGFAVPICLFMWPALFLIGVGTYFGNMIYEKKVSNEKAK